MNQYPMQGIASLVAAQGRGGDSTLVHMTPDEVRSLQALARSRGMELPINPETGYPEANFLSILLGNLWKGFRTVGTAAIQNPQLTGAIVGGAYGAYKGDLQKGLEMGMKAYAGTALLGGISSLTEAAKRSASTTATKSPTPDGGLPAADGETAPKPAENDAATTAKPGTPQTTVRQPSGIENALRNILGGNQSDTTSKQGGIFNLQNPLAQAIALYTIDRAERKAQAKNQPVFAPQTYTPATFSYGQVNPRRNEPGQPYFIGGGYNIGQSTTQFPDYTGRTPIGGQSPQGQAPPGRGPPGQPPPSTPAPNRTEPLDFYRPPQTQSGYTMAGGGIVPRPNPSYPMSRVPGNGYEVPVGAYTGEETFAEGGVTDTEEERRRKYFENLRPFAPALTDYYRGTPNTGRESDQGDIFLRVTDPFTGLTVPAPTGVKTGIAALQPYDESLAEWYRSLLNPPIGRLPVDTDDYYKTTAYRAQPQFGEIPVYTPAPTIAPPPPPPPTRIPLPSCGPGFTYNPETMQCEPEPYPTPIPPTPEPTLPPETPFPPTPEPTRPPETPFPPTPEPTLPPETPKPTAAPPTPVPPTPEPTLPPETSKAPITCQDRGYPPGWDYDANGKCQPPAPPETPIPPTPEPTLPPETPRPTAAPPTPVPPTPEPTLPPETPKPPITCQDRNYPPGWDYDENGECQPPAPPETPIITPEPSPPPETRGPRETPFPPIITPEPSPPPQTQPPSESEPPEDPNKDPDTGKCFSGFFKGPFGICTPYPRQGPCLPGMFYDLLRGCVKYWNPEWGDPLPGIPGSSLPPIYPKGVCPDGMMSNPYTGKGCVPVGTEVSPVPVDNPNKCPEGYQSQRYYNEYKRITEYYCYKLPDMVSEREQLKRQECIKLGLDYDTTTFTCKPKDNNPPGTTYNPPTTGGTGGNPPGTGYTPPPPPGGTITVITEPDRKGIVTPGSKPCLSISAGGQPSYFYVGADEPCPDGSYDEKGAAAGGYVKKGKIRKKKYQAGGIASLTRDPNLGAAVNMMDGYNFGFAQGGMAAMPEYQAGGKLLRGAGDGMSDDIPAVIRGKGIQRAALADGEFVIPADVVSHLGNGSTEAGAKKLYKMMAQIRAARTGRKKQAPRVNPDKYLPRV